MVVAAGAPHGQAHPDRRRGVDPVDHVLQLVLLGNGAALEIDHVVAVESGGQLLTDRRAGEKVARQLLDGELVEGLVPIEGIDDPVPPEPHVPMAVDVVAVGVGIAAGVEPLQGHPLAVVPGGEEPFHHSFIGPGAPVRQEGVYLFRRGGQSGQVQGQSTDQGDGVGFGRRSKPLAFEAGQDESVDGVADPGDAVHLGEGRPARFDEGPMVLGLGAFGDPAPDEVDLILVQLPVESGWRHPRRLVLRRYSLVQAARFRVSRSDDLVAVPILEQSLLRVQVQTRLPHLFVRAVTGETVVREDGAYLAAVVYGAGRRLGLSR